MFEHANIRHCRGTGLIEVMVTVVVLAVGLLGIAALQVQSKRSNFEAIQRTTATMLAHAIIERMRANPSALGTYLTDGDEVGGETITSEPSPDCSAGSPCSTVQLASHDVWDWEQSIDGASEAAGGNNTGGLVSPTACLTGPGGGGPGTYTVAIAWRGQNLLANPTTNACGEGSGKYDGPGGTDPDAFRRVLTFDVFIDTS